MIKNIFIILAILFTVSCKKEDASSTEKTVQEKLTGHWVSTYGSVNYAGGSKVVFTVNGEFPESFSNVRFLDDNLISAMDWNFNQYYFKYEFISDQTVEICLSGSCSHYNYFGPPEDM